MCPTYAPLSPRYELSTCVMISVQSCTPTQHSGHQEAPWTVVPRWVVRAPRGRCGAMRRETPCGRQFRGKGARQVRAVAHSCTTGVCLGGTHSCCCSDRFVRNAVRVGACARVDAHSCLCVCVLCACARVRVREVRLSVAAVRVCLSVYVCMCVVVELMRRCEYAVMMATRLADDCNTNCG